MAFVTYHPSGAPAKAAANAPFASGSPTSQARSILIAAVGAATIGALPAARDAVMDQPVHDSAGSQFTLQYNRWIRSVAPNRVDLRVRTPAGEDVMVTVGGVDGADGRILRIEPVPISTTYIAGTVTFVFKAPPQGDLGLSFDVQMPAIGWTSQAVYIGVGRTTSAAMAIHQLVIP